MRPLRELLRRSGPVAFVLGGGGNLGAIQVGMLRALVENGIRPDMVLGCSVGALNGASFCSDPTLMGIVRLEELWRGLDGKDVMPTGWMPTAMNFARRGEAVHDVAGLRRIIESALTVERFEELAVPFECVATAIDEAREVWFAEGPLLEPILASAALPAIYPAVTIDGVRYLDGAIVNDVPISRAVERGAGTIYVLHVGSYDRPRPEPKRPLDVAFQAYWVARRHRFHRELATLPKHVEAIVLPTGAPPVIPYNDFTHSESLMSNAYRATSQTLSDLARAGA